MIKFEYTWVSGWEAVVRGMRNPMNSWEKSDSLFDGNKWCLGDNDFKLMKNLVCCLKILDLARTIRKNTA